MPCGPLIPSVCDVSIPLSWRTLSTASWIIFAKSSVLMELVVDEASVEMDDVESVELLVDESVELPELDELKKASRASSMAFFIWSSRSLVELDPELLELVEPSADNSESALSAAELVLDVLEVAEVPEVDEVLEEFSSESSHW
jgi:hypothetical protein